MPAARGARRGRPVWSSIAGCGIHSIRRLGAEPAVGRPRATSWQRCAQDVRGDMLAGQARTCVGGSCGVSCQACRHCVTAHPCSGLRVGSGNPVARLSICLRRTSTVCLSSSVLQFFRPFPRQTACVGEPEMDIGDLQIGQTPKTSRWWSPRSAVVRGRVARPVWVGRVRPGVGRVPRSSGRSRRCVGASVRRCVGVVSVEWPGRGQIVLACSG
ncbi:hypothetical protein E143388_07340 [Rhodococcus opacus]|nr:hypothetical protein E143388_07340 [Rhodococcus opacus]